MIVTPVHVLSVLGIIAVNRKGEQQVIQVTILVCDLKSDLWILHSLEEDTVTSEQPGAGAPPSPPPDAWGEIIQIEGNIHTVV